MLLGRRELIKAALRGLLAVTLGGIPQPEADAIQAEPDVILVEPDIALEAGEPVRDVRQPGKGAWLEVGGRLYACDFCTVKHWHDVIEERDDSGEFLGLADRLSSWKITAILKGDGDGLRDVMRRPSAVDVMVYGEGMAYGGRGVLDEFVSHIEFAPPSLTILGDGELMMWRS